MATFLRVSGVVLVLMGFMGAGFVLGAKRGGVPTTSVQRFERISDTEAFDTKTGKACSLKDIAPLPGFTLDEPNCSDLAKQ
jgi:hypothetical protein